MLQPSHLNLIALTHVLAAAALAQTPLPQNAPLTPVVLRSPDKHLGIGFDSSMSPFPIRYSIYLDDKYVIRPSGLKLDLQNQPSLGDRMSASTSTRSQHDATYQRLSGKASTIRDHYNAMSFEFTEPGPAGRKLIIEARAYDDAIAFRYLIPAQPNLKDLRLTAEHTEFSFPKDPNLYALVLPNFTSQYESEFLRITASTLAAQGGGSTPRLVGLPLLMQIPGLAWVAITEADLHNSTSMYLTNPSVSWGPQALESRLAPHLDDPSLAVTASLPWHSAWRIIQVAADPGRFIESNIVSNLSPESALADTSWIHPGKASWDWWSGSLGPDGKPAFNTATMKYYVDFAAQSHFEYMLIDAGWSAQMDIVHMNGKVDVPEVVRYAKTKNVKVWIWAHSKALWKQMDEAFPLYEKWGVAGVKTDFVERDDQEGIDFYYRSAALAARHHIMIDYHGATKPTGIERTWPNILGFEAVMGMEYNKGNARETPTHEVTLPFTRMLAGPMDYTPGGFNNVTDAQFEPRMISPMVRGTRAHQLAMYAIYEAAFQMVSDSPKAYEDQPAFDFIRSAPTAWDESKVLNGVPAEYITMARRRGREWFLGSMTNWTPRDLEIPLTFLGPGKYRAAIYADAEDADHYPKNVSIRTGTVDRNTLLKTHLAPAGGYAVHFVPLNP